MSISQVTYSGRFRTSLSMELDRRFGLTPKYLGATKEGKMLYDLFNDPTRSKKFHLNPDFTIRQEGMVPDRSEFNRLVEIANSVLTDEEVRLVSEFTGLAQQYGEFCAISFNELVEQNKDISIGAIRRDIVTFNEAQIGNRRFMLAQLSMHYGSNL